MKLNRLFILGVLVLCASRIVRADGIPSDGKVVVGHGTDPATPVGCGSMFNVPLNGNGGGIKNCFNDSGQDYFGLEITAMIPDTNIVNCTSDIFLNCSYTATKVGNSGKDKVSIFLTGGEIPSSSFATPASEFFLNFNNSGSSTSGTGGWFGVDGTGVVKVTAILVPTPEPSVVMLILVGGLGVLCFWRKSQFC